MKTEHVETSELKHKFEVDWSKVDKEHLSYKILDMIQVCIPRIGVSSKIPQTPFTKIRIGHQYDGGYILLDEVCRDTDVVYSFGIGWDTSFDQHFAHRYDAKIKMYDHTIPFPPKHEHPSSYALFTNESGQTYITNSCEEPRGRGVPVPNSEFFKTGLGPLKTEDLDTLENIATHTSYGKAVLKMDIEGDEWEALSVTPDKVLRSFGQITMEMHDLEDESKYPLIYKVLKKLNQSFMIFHAHIPNSCNPVKINGLLLPPRLEISYLNWGHGIGSEADNSPKPAEFDAPNMWDQPDYDMNYWPYVR